MNQTTITLFAVAAVFAPSCEVVARTYITNNEVLPRLAFTPVTSHIFPYYQFGGGSTNVPNYFCVNRSSPNNEQPW